MLPILRETADTVRIFDAATGEEVIVADATTDVLAELRLAIRDDEEDLRLAKQALDAELLARLDKAAQWTAKVNGFKLSAPSPAPGVEYDAEALRTRLVELARDGVIADEAVNAAVELVTSFKTHARGIQALRKLGGIVAEAVDDCSREVPRTRRVTVTRLGS